MKVVLDVNILGSAALRITSLPGMVLTECQINHSLFASDLMIERLALLLTESYFARRLPTSESLAFVAELLRHTDTIEPDTAVRGIAPDLEDDLVLGTAVAARADFLVTGDKGLLAIGEYGGVGIVTARGFLTMLGLVESEAGPR